MAAARDRDIIQCACFPLPSYPAGKSVRTASFGLHLILPAYQPVNCIFHSIFFYFCK